MKKPHNILTEHYLIPAILFLLNICLPHVIYAFVAASTYSISERIALALAFALLIGSLFFKRQFLLVGSILFYALVVLIV
jgi:hypothetical protein